MDNLELHNILLKNYGIKKYISPKEMNITDNNCEYLGIPKMVLMENAGKSIADEVVNYLVKNNKNKIFVFCGLGNNGGDGFVAIRHLIGYCDYMDKISKSSGFIRFPSLRSEITVILLGKEKEIKTYESKENFKILKNIGELDFRLKIKEMACPNEILKVIKNIKTEKENVIIIDAMLGTGIKGELREPFKTVVNELNNLNKSNNIKIISVDTETKGLNGDLIITFHKHKLDNELNKTNLKKIGIPPIAEHIVGWGDLKALSKINPDSHKGDNGKVLVVGGSKEFFGAPILSALASSKIVDLVTVASVKNTMDALRNYPELMGYEIEGNYFGEEHINEIVELSKKYNVVILGNGLSVNNSTKKFVNGFLMEMDKLNKKVVIDADAIKVIEYENFIFNENFIFTPHKKEFEYMGLDVNNINNIYGIPWSSTIVLKGKYDLIFNKNNIKINKTGNAGMTVGGTGDALCGIIGALFCKNDAFISGCCGAFINGYAGDLLLKEKGYYYNVIDIIDNIPIVLALYG
ncbi:NAD(P)H-hydrate dehydratase [Methanococcus aeolicus]|uniref:ADP-dependent (S)-NAD(P)H-hydrate dehydratase n=1 Tax=Methanococcus aeolicus (strain ATCC BAA-1280 / DSM 17508 / OCM 812 / Nankai-3) TaxID=419665 RepID=A6UTR2_META3|nr:NAD(P)H-hydrate dehydratase [Methanococcus aeolicus]ABR55884.1 carbohydrate kinase, YjeF related protein [Methanococcus aeolicus Nankai-3]UXM84011.1 NAD(P)H-hydrate dehydratase [Methanococcus aeolicus]